MGRIMNTVDMMKHLDQIVLHAKAIKILKDPAVTLIQAQDMIKEMFRQYEADSEDYYPDESFEVEEKSLDQEMREDDARERARDINAVNRSPF